MTNRVSILLLVLFGGTFAGISLPNRGGAAPLGSAFTYQGRLSEAGAPAQGLYDLRFGLFTNEVAGNAVTAPLTNFSVNVSNGLFTTALDFGANVFSGANSWLEIAVRPAGLVESFVPLAPRQLLTPAPYSIYTLKAETLVGPLPDAQLSANIARLDANQTFAGNVSFVGRVGVGTTNPGAALDVQGIVQAAGFSGNGAGLTNLAATTLSAQLAQRLWRVAIPFVAVTNAGNLPDATGSGAVLSDFRIGKYEINNLQYAAFLNAVAAEDPHSLYSSNMSVTIHGGIERSGSPGEFSYSVKPGMGHRPVVWVDFHDALRFCNWLHHGQPTGPQDNSTTEDGAYTLTPESVLANSVARNPGARFWLPSDDEWYKAAYHQPAAAGGDTDDYWDYPNRSNDAPFSEPPPGSGNSVNACCEAGRMSTDVGAYTTSTSFYGTFDQGGNVQEWTEEIIFLTNRRLRGGSWAYNEYYSQASDFEFDTPDYDAEAIGFRVAGAPER